MMSSIVKCHLLDDELVKMTIDALDTIYPYSDETIAVITPDSITPTYFLDYCIDKNITLLEAEKGFPNFVSKGMEVSHGDYVAVLNNDILMPSDWSKKLLGLFEENTIMVHPKTLKWEGEEFYKGRQVRYNIDPKEGLFFSAFILNKKLYDKVKWDTDYDYWGFDDWDFYYRSRKLGFDSIWTDTTQYKHKSGATIKKIGREQFIEKNRALFIKKHGIIPSDIEWYAI